MWVVDRPGRQEGEDRGMGGGGVKGAKRRVVEGLAGSDIYEVIAYNAGVGGDLKESGGGVGGHMVDEELADGDENGEVLVE